MSSVASKNLFDLLGNDVEGEDQLPVIPVEKPQPRVGKRDGPGEAPVRDANTRGNAVGRGGRKGEPKSANERAFRDRDAGRDGNRGKPIDDGLRTDRHSNTLEGGRIQRGGRYDGRGGRGGAGGRGGRGGKDDRHSRTGIGEHPRQEAKGWGEETGTGEWADERAAEAIAKADEKDAAIEADSTKPVDANGDPIPDEEAAPEDKTKSYADYLAEQAEKKLKLGGTLAARKANEGGKEPQGTAISREEQDFFAGSGGKAGRQRERKAKDNQLLLDHDLIARDSGRSERGGRGGRGGRRGDGPREGGRGGRGGRGDRGDRAPRGEGRGGPRGGAGRSGPTPNLSDQSAFPSLGK